MENKLKFSIFQYFLGIFILLSTVYAFGQENSKTVKDIEGNVYNTVTIGTQVWTKENLKTTRYSNGDLISPPKYQWAYAGEESNVEIYGRLYNWYAATDSRNICPTGWHVPTDAEWTTLAKYLGGEGIASIKLKEAGTSHWKSLNDATTNSSGFTALPGGYRNHNGSFGLLGNYSGWWSSTEGSENFAWHRGMANDINSALSYYSNKTFGFSLRCIKN